MTLTVIPMIPKILQPQEADAVPVAAANARLSGRGLSGRGLVIRCLRPRFRRHAASSMLWKDTSATTMQEEKKRRPSVFVIQTKSSVVARLSTLYCRQADCKPIKQA